MTKGIIFSGSHPRHMFIHKQVLDLFDDVLIILMEREELIREPPKNLKEIDKNNFLRHFKERYEVENKVYGNLTIENTYSSVTDIIKIKPQELNTNYINERVKDFDADISFIFGTHIIKEPLISTLPDNKINLHLGLSPWYKGGATLFWPFYFLEPQFSGITLHQITEKPDAGEILHQECPILDSNDGIHDVGAKCVVSAGESTRKLLKKIIVEKNLKGKIQKTSGRVWRGVDFHASHLRMIYNTYDNDIVKEYIDGNLSSRKPNLFSVL